MVTSEGDPDPSHALSTNAPRWPTLGPVESRSAIASVTARSVWLRAALAFALVAIASSARAQEESEDEDDAQESAEQQAEDGGEYEPDQRGEHDDEEEQAEDGGEYEPDQRGELEEEEVRQVAPTSLEVAAGDMASAPESYGRSRLGVDLSLWLGPSYLDVDVGGQSLVRSTQRSSAGAAFGLAAALRVGPVAIGPRLGFSLDGSMLLVNTALGVDVFLLRGPLVPYVRASIGLSLARPIGDVLAAQSDAQILGVGAELGGGARWYFDDGVFLGGELTGGWHHLWREALPECTEECTDGELDLRRAGESDALSFRLALTFGWSF